MSSECPRKDCQLVRARMNYESEKHAKKCVELADARERIAELERQLAPRMHLTQNQARTLANQLLYFADTGETPRMHLTQEQARTLANQLLYFADTGELPAVLFKGGATHE